MGIYGAIARASEAEVAALRGADDGTVSTTLSDWSEEGPARVFQFDKAWCGVHFLLQGAGQPVDVILGGEPVSDDLGYGPARSLTGAQVKEAAAFLRAMPWESLVTHYDGPAMDSDGIYPGDWSGPDLTHGQDWLKASYEDLPEFVGQAADSGDRLADVTVALLPSGGGFV